MPSIPVIVIGGGPCGGKSTLLVQIREHLEKFGMYPLILSETATELIGAGVSPSLIGNDFFQERLFLYSIDREEHYLEIAKGVEGKKIVILCDRGVLDGAAYMEDGDFRNMVAKLGYSIDTLRHRYDLVIHLVTAANGAEEFYTLENNAARSESPDAARKLDVRTQSAWLGHPHHVIIDNSTDFPTKMHRALCALSRRLDMPDPLEIERKFLVKNFLPEQIPKGAATSEITQDYLVCEDGGERRVRMRLCDGERSFTHTEKMPTGKSGTRIEHERHIEEEEYLALLETARAPGSETIKKIRHAFSFEGRIFELDVYKEPYVGLVILEVEIQDRYEKIALPPQFNLLEVTDDPLYSNQMLAGA